MDKIWEKRKKKNGGRVRNVCFPLSELVRKQMVCLNIPWAVYTEAFRKYDQLRDRHK